MTDFVVIGSQGMLGSDLIKILQRQKKSYAGIAHEEIDISSLSSCQKVLNPLKPKIIINAAAYTAVDAAEDNPLLAYSVNATGPKNVAVVAQKINSFFCHISTDYVFDGQKGAPYLETDSPSPTSLYGQSKLEGETAIQQITSQFLLIRTAWLFGGERKNFVRTMLQLAQNKPEISVVNDQFGSPTYTVDLALRIIELCKNSIKGIFHITNSGICSWFEFAQEILSMSGYTTPLHPIPSTQFPSRVKRPSYSVLDNSGTRMLGMPSLPPWQDALKRYLKELKIFS